MQETAKQIKSATESLLMDSTLYPEERVNKLVFILQDILEEDNPRHFQNDIAPYISLPGWYSLAERYLRMYSRF
jgi:hypothetical protein